MEIRERNKGWERFGREFVVKSDTGAEVLVVSRNHPVGREYQNKYHVKTPNRTGFSLTDEAMEELFLAWQLMKREYETGQDIKIPIEPDPWIPVLGPEYEVEYEEWERELLEGR